MTRKIADLAVLAIAATPALAQAAPSAVTSDAKRRAATMFTSEASMSYEASNIRASCRTRARTRNHR